MTDPMGLILQVNDLDIRYRYGRAKVYRAVSGISFGIAPGEVLGMVGESGCGKTSIALALLGLLPKKHVDVSGSIRFRGQELLSMDERSLQNIRGAEISLVFQESAMALSPVMRVGDQVAEVVRAHNDRDWTRCCAKAESMLARVGLSPTDRIFSAYPHQLSGGQRQRVCLAQAFVCEPALVIADEPTASLDASTQASLVSLLLDLKRELHTSVLLISHTPELQARLADRILVMAQGKVVEEGSFADVYSRPSHALTKALLKRQVPNLALAEFHAQESIAQESAAR
jgi:peptide/nickel transport system ATP-binding protein